MGSIRFETDIEPLTTDIIQTVKVALIINEAVINAIKYAFPHQKNGVTALSFTRNEEKIAPKVANNGICALIAIEQLNSVGLILMDHLPDDLHGLFTIKNKNGTTVQIVFTLDAVWAA